MHISRNHFCYCSVSLLQTKPQKTQKQLQKICKQSCTALQKPSALGKKPSDCQKHTSGKMCESWRHSFGHVSYIQVSLVPGLLAPVFVACSTNAGEGLVKLSHVV